MWPFDKNEKAGEVLDDTQKDDGTVIATVEIERKTRQIREVKAVVIDCNTSKTLLRATFETQKTDFGAFNVASDFIKAFIKAHDYVLTGEITCIGGDLPTVKTVQKRTR